MTETTASDVRSGMALLARGDVVLIAIAFVLPVLAYPGVAQGLAGRWLAFDQAYSHGFFVLAITLWLASRVLRRRRYTAMPSAIGVALALLTSLMIALAQAIQVEIIQQIGLVFLVWALVLALTGWLTAWHLLFPVGFLAFAVPFWDYFAYPLQRLTAAVSGLLLSVWNIRFSLDETVIHLEDIGSIVVANGCSGQRYLVIALTLAALYSYLNLRRVSSWVLTLGIATVLALLTNWVRVFVLVLVGYESVMTSPLLHNHEFFGWVLFLGLLVPLIWLVNRLGAREVSLGDSAPGSRQLPGHAAEGRGRSWVAILVAVLALPAVVLPPLALQRSAGVTNEALTIDFPAKLQGWSQRSPVPGRAWQPMMRGTDLVATTVYARGDDRPRVGFGIWLYQNQRPGQELIQYGNHIVDPARFVVERQDEVDVNGFRGERLELARRRGNDRVIVTYSYRVAGHWTAAPVVAKGLQVLALFTGEPGAALVAVSAVCADDCQAAITQVQRFLKTAPQWQALLSGG